MKGFAVRSGFAFTQGAVMSNTDTWTPTSDLFKHETIHIWQNLVLGPFFWFSYVGWMALTIIPALIAGLIDSGRRIGDAITWWTYFDNPWEVMAYGIANPSDRTGQVFMSGGGTVTGWVCWPWPLAIVLSAVGVVGLGAAFVAILVAGYG